MTGVVSISPTWGLLTPIIINSSVMQCSRMCIKAGLKYLVFVKMLEKDLSGGDLNSSASSWGIVAIIRWTLAMIEISSADLWGSEYWCMVSVLDTKLTGWNDVSATSSQIFVKVLTIFVKKYNTNWHFFTNCKTLLCILGDKSASKCQHVLKKIAMYERKVIPLLPLTP